MRLTNGLYLCGEKYCAEEQNRKMKQITFAICDDEIEDALNLQEILHEILPGAETRIFKSADSLLKILKTKGNPFHIIFLDIRMKGKNGIETAAEIRKSDKTVPIIFASVSGEYYKEAFDVFAYQYLRKPLNKRKVEKVLDPLIELLMKDEEPTLHFRYRSQTYTLRHSQVQYISSSLHTVNFHLSNGRAIQCRGKLNDFTDQLAGTSFVRCHQSFFVNMDAVTSMKTDTFEVGENLIPISRSLSKDVQMQYEKYLKKE